MKRLHLLFLLSLLGFAYLFGQATLSVYLGWSMGTRTVEYRGGSSGDYTAIIGPAAPRPAWIPLLPGATIASGFYAVTGSFQGQGSVTLVTRKQLDDIKKFYFDELGALGYKVTDEGIGNLNVKAADYLGIAGMLSAERDDAKEYQFIGVQIRTADGLLVKSRELRVMWYRTKPEIPKMRPSQATTPGPT